jgi:hypothetical protein
MSQCRHGEAAAEVAPRAAPSPALPLLTLTASFHYPEDRWDEVNDKLKQLLTMLLTRLAHDGPATPVDGSFSPASPVPGVRLSDLPRPVQAQVLCTAMVNTGAPNDIRTNLDGRCSAEGDGRTAQVSVDRDSHGQEQFTAGGRPARFGEDGARCGSTWPSFPAAPDRGTSSWRSTGPARTSRPSASGLTGSWVRLGEL